MIWVDGRIVPDQALTISVLDRTFEHGLGLFETLRTWQGGTPLLDRHLARLRKSAKALGLPLETSALPDLAAVTQLLEANGHVGDAALRLTLTGGVSDAAGATLWMRSAPLPPSMITGPGAVVDFGSWWVDPNDPLLRHKTLNYWRRRSAYQDARERGFDEILSVSAGLNLWEGSRTNLFFVAGNELVTPALDGPIVPGIMRELVLELAPSSALEIREVTNLEPNDLQDASEVFLTNSVRGVIPVARLGDLSWDVPGGPRTVRLKSLLSEWLNEGGTTS
ncbi:aminotransferase class IV [Singulisphaera acidiphila]|uniref:branched-chain-amino-acid transaminase n=1 Tax=Singulisphaera acidiphila (strain ATCC BAA-1392 / DSM 18658 / VKM B-2454 / MOB10) TaxID=886293 RepID=L0DM06_SINAD|nr:aminotransferase class IV [Singulisphaera acidiphila]AGA30404.1 branched-chain amino acid aminotransferase/4-amino-4-deoxychorismate lyase [Singulisphaera acidiphila DSM 18658]